MLFTECKVQVPSSLKQRKESQIYTQNWIISEKKNK